MWSAVLTSSPMQQHDVADSVCCCQLIVQVWKDQHTFLLKQFQCHLNIQCEDQGRKKEAEWKDSELICPALKHELKKPSVVRGNGNMKICILQIHKDESPSIASLTSIICKILKGKHLSTWGPGWAWSSHFSSRKENILSGISQGGCGGLLALLHPSPTGFGSLTGFLDHHRKNLGAHWGSVTELKTIAWVCQQVYCYL